MSSPQPAPARTASTRGPRTVNADAVASYTDPGTGQLVVALADGVGDSAASAAVAQVAAAAAVRSPLADGPIAALVAAQAAVAQLGEDGDSVLVIAQPTADGYRIAWVGDVRAYAVRPDGLRQLTKDHTLAQYFRSRGEPTTPRMEHVVTTSVRTARPGEFGRTEYRGPGELLLTSDGVHKVLTPATMLALLRRDGSATAMVDAAIGSGGTDNATALVVEQSPAVTVVLAHAA